MLDCLRGAAHSPKNSYLCFKLLTPYIPDCPLLTTPRKYAETHVI
jgi:hypothetical protein